MPKFSLNPFSKGGLPSQVFNGSKKLTGGFLEGTPEKRENVSTLRPEQEAGFEDLQAAAQGRQSNGAFGKAANYYNNLLSDDSADYNAFAAPQIRQFNEQIMPGISEQFAGMVAGGLSSSGFRNAGIAAGTDLSERLGAIRANLRQSGAQGLQGIGQAGLGSFSQNMVTQPGSEGFLSSLAPAIGTAAGAFFAGPPGAAAGGAAGNWLKNSFGGNKVGMKSGPYGNTSGIPASPQFNLPGRSF